jgi:hypothetical protein
MCNAGLCFIIVWSAVSYCTFSIVFETSCGQRRPMVEIKLHVMKLEFEGLTSNKIPALVWIYRHCVS